MAPRPAPRKWTDIQMVIATIAMTTVLGLWNMFAGPDREKAAQKAALDQVKVVPTPTEIPTATAVSATMPPPGFTIIYGGEAPKPQVIVQRGGGGGGGGGGDGGGGGGGAVTSSGSS